VLGQNRLKCRLEIEFSTHGLQLKPQEGMGHLRQVMEELGRRAQVLLLEAPATMAEWRRSPGATRVRQEPREVRVLSIKEQRC